MHLLALTAMIGVEVCKNNIDFTYAFLFSCILNPTLNKNSLFSVMTTFATHIILNGCIVSDLPFSAPVSFLGGTG